MSINLVICLDENYISKACVMLESLFSNNNCEIIAHIVGIEEENGNIIKSQCLKYNVSCKFYSINSELFNNFPIPDNSELAHISLATYYRLFIHKLLPKTISKVIYLDCDIIVNESILPLFNIDISSYSLAAVYQSKETSIINCSRLNYPNSYGYFNAGVLLINLEFWRENNLLELFYRYIKDNYSLIYYHDQDILNATLFGSCLEIPKRFNYFLKEKYTYHHNDKIIDLAIFSRFGVNLNCKMNPIIIHYASSSKPWHGFCQNYYTSLYFKYLKLSYSQDNQIEPYSFFSKAYRNIKLLNIKLVRLTKREI